MARLSIDRLEDRVLLTVDLAVYTDFPPGSPLVIATGDVSPQPMKVSVLNESQAPTAAADFMTGWQTKLVVIPKGSATGTVLFDSFAVPAVDYVFENINTFSASYVCQNVSICHANIGDTFVGAEANFPYQGGTEIPGGSAVNLVEINYGTSSIAAGRFGVYVVSDPLSGWTDATTGTQQDIPFTNAISDGTSSMVEIGEVLVLSGPGDANLDGRVSFSDFLRLQNSFRQPGVWENGDFNLDGIVTFADFLILQNHFGRVYFTPPVQSVAVANSDGPLQDSIGQKLLGPKLDWKDRRFRMHDAMVHFHDVPVPVFRAPWESVEDSREVPGQEVVLAHLPLQDRGPQDRLRKRTLPGADDDRINETDVFRVIRRFDRSVSEENGKFLAHASGYE